VNLLRRWAWLALLAPVFLGLARLRFDADVLNLLPADLPAVRGLRLQQQHFARDAELIVTVAAADPEAAETAARRVAETLRAEPRLVAAAHWRPPGWERPAAPAEFLAWLWLNQPPAALRDLAARLAPAALEARLRAVRESLATTLTPAALGRLAYDPLGLTELPEAAAPGLSAGSGQGEELFAAPDGTFRLVLVEPGPAGQGFATAPEWIAQLRACLARARARSDWPAGVTLGWTGKPAFVAEAAAGMRRDIRRSVTSTLAGILVLFWLAHRRWAPLLWLAGMLQVILLGAAALGGLLLGTLNLVSLGFAAILLGLAVDYGLVLYQEVRDQPRAGAGEIRRQLGPAVRGSAFTTAAAFGLLWFGGLPGLGQLGLLVALGVLIAAEVMLRAYLPLVCRARPEAGTISSPDAPGVGTAPGRGFAELWFSRLALPGTAVLGVLGLALLARGLPPVDSSTRSLGPRHSPAAEAMAELERRFARGGEPVFVLVRGREPGEVRARLERLQTRLEAARQRGAITGYELPLALWPAPSWQAENLPVAAALAARSNDFFAALDRAGFAESARDLAAGVCGAWARLAGANPPVWPAGEAARWLVARAAARVPEGWLAAGLVRGAKAAEWAAPGEELEGVTFCGWQLLGEALLRHIEPRVAGLAVAVTLALAGCLRLTLGGWRAVGWSFAALAFGLFLLLAGMAAAGGSWHLMNLPALPLLLGAGVDYTIHVQLALRRHAGDVAAVLRTTGRALRLCAATTAVAFGSLVGAGHAGLAGLGAVCAAGVVCLWVSALYFLPAWTQAGRRHPPAGH
jgi:predicted exporter